MTTFAERLAALLPDAPRAAGQSTRGGCAVEGRGLVPKANQGAREFLPYGVEALTGKAPGFEDRKHI